MRRYYALAISLGLWFHTPCISLGLWFHTPLASRFVPQDCGFTRPYKVSLRTLRLRGCGFTRPQHRALSPELWFHTPYKLSLRYDLSTTSSLDTRFHLSRS